MLQDLSSRRYHSRVIAVVIVGLAVVAIVPLRLVARPSQETLAAVSVESTAPQTPAAKPATVAQTQPEEQVERPSAKAGELRYVLFWGDDHTMSGSTQDVERAERYRKNDEPLLWVSYDGREYVVRDPEVVGQARELVKNAYREEIDPAAIREMVAGIDHQEIAKHAEFAARHASEMAMASLEQANLAEHIARATEHGALAASAGLEIAAHVMKSLADGEIFKHQLDSKEFEHHIKALEKSADKLGDSITKDLEHKMRNFEHHFEKGIEKQMKELEHQLGNLEKPMHDMAVPFEEFGQRMEEFGRRMEDVSRRVEGDLQKMIERAIARGQAQSVR